MAVNGQLVARSPGSNLLQRLDDPGTAAALGRLLDHADLTTLSGGLAGAAPTINALLTSALMRSSTPGSKYSLTRHELVAKPPVSRNKYASNVSPYASV